MLIVDNVGRQAFHTKLSFPGEAYTCFPEKTKRILFLKRIETSFPISCPQWSQFLISLGKDILASFAILEYYVQNSRLLIFKSLPPYQNEDFQSSCLRLKKLK